MSHAELLAHLALLGIQSLEYNSSVYKLTNLISIHVGVTVSIYYSKLSPSISVDRYSYPISEQDIIKSVNRITQELAQVGITA